MEPSISLYPLRFHFVTSECLHFPASGAANVLRGALGTISRRLAGDQDGTLHQRFFEPASQEGPSGFRNRPRPFVLRAAHLDERTLAPGEAFHFDLHLFDIRNAQESIAHLGNVFAEMAQEGLGPRRSRVRLIHPPEARLLTLSLNPSGETVTRLAIEFRTPTEIKGDDAIGERPEFGLLFDRIRDRICALRSFYGDGPMDLDFEAQSTRAAAVRLELCELQQVKRERRSSRTGQKHSLGGFVGHVEYEGNLAEFWPWLKAAEWTGAGRQTVWGKGEIAVNRLEPGGG